MPFLFHPDIKTHYYHTRFLQQGVFDIYSYIEQNKDSLGYKDTFNYPPLTYFFLGSWFLVTSPFLGDSFNKWEDNWGEYWYTSTNIFRYLFILKLPYLILDLLIGYIFIRLLDKRNIKNALIIWFFNPITIYIIYGLSNFDIIPTFFTLLSLLMFKEKKYFATGVSLGLGASFKLFPLLLVPFFLIPLIKEHQFKNAGWILLSTLGIFALMVVPLLNGFLSISNSGLTSKIFEMKLNFGVVSIPIFYFIYGFLIMFFWIKKLSWWNTNLFIVATLLLLISITKIHPQWLLWVLPFLTIIIATNLRLLIVMIPFIVGYLGLIISLEDRFLLLGIISPIFPNIYDVSFLEKSLLSLISKTNLVVLSQSLIAISSLIIFYQVYKKKYE